MFVIRKIIDGVLYDVNNAFADCFEKWNDPSYLHQFFTDNPECLLYYDEGRKVAAKKVRRAANKLFQQILDIAENEIPGTTLDYVVFHPLRKTHSLEESLAEAKAFGWEGGIKFLRLYALRLDDGSYVVTGGLIKTTQRLQESEEGQRMVRLLKDVANYLLANKISDSVELGSLEIGS